jgi:hypothetical protein
MTAYTWEVHPYDPRKEPIVASGMTDDRDRAKQHVEHVLTTDPVRARWGEVAITGTTGGEACLRRDGTLVWLPRFPTPQELMPGRQGIA